MMKIYKALLLIASIFFLVNAAYAEIKYDAIGYIKGKVTTADGNPAAAVTVAIKGAKKSTLTDEEGQFILPVAEGSYNIVISLTGHETITKEVMVRGGETVFIEIQLTVTDKQLDEVIITTGRNRFSKKESEFVARMPLKNLENPQVYNIVGKAFLKEQLIIDQEDVLKNIPGVMSMRYGGGSPGLIMRGFLTNARVRNGMDMNGVGPRDPSSLERVEAIKGPSGTLFGSIATFGGLVNYVTKKPYDHFGGEITFTTGSWQLHRLTADINTPLNESKTALFRLNAAATGENSFQDQGFNRSYAINPSLVYKMNERLTLSLDAEMVRLQMRTPVTTPTFASDVTYKSFDDIQLDYKRSFINNSISNKNGSNGVYAKADYIISDKWKSTTSYSWSEGFYDHYFSIVPAWLTDSTFKRNIVSLSPDRTGNIQFQQNFNGDFFINGLRNRLLVGVTYANNYRNRNSTGTNTYDVVNILHPIAHPDVKAINNWAANFTWNDTKTNVNTYAAYLSNVLNITDQLMVMLSLRVENVNNKGSYNARTGLSSGDFNQTAVSPKIGLVYQVIKDRVSVFGNYMNGFQNVAPVSQPDGSISVFKPQQGNQWEAGVKLDAWNGKLSSTISYYNILVTDATRPEVINNQTFTIQDGEQRSKGFEADVIVNPVGGLNIAAGYGYNQNKFIKAAKAVEGKYATLAPAHTATLWMSYKLLNGKAQGLGIGAGGNYSSDAWYNSANTFTLPGYLLINASLFYEKPQYRLSIKMNNLLNEKYWNTEGNPQKPTNFMASVAYKF